VTTLAISAQHLPVIKILAVLPVAVAVIQLYNPKPELRQHHYCKKPVMEANYQAFKPGFYHMSGNATDEIFKSEKEADGQIDLSMYTLSRCQQLMDSSRWSSPRLNIPPSPYFPRQGKPNGLLVVRLSHAVAYDQPVDLIHAINKYAVHRGYKRVLILGDHAVGVYVVCDSAYKREYQDKSDR